ncbi:type II secretion system F family protein [Paenibacillus sp. L3-i20]|uniref:type II secretion system F family protein n=1 Tax=Paenibacillus sp. L3-i20 TaxID=2905833 RepID=UPI0020BF9861|nr:type II secretion system F family protein [Paenibacillus sp. L3-i20]
MKGFVIWCGWEGVFPSTSSRETNSLPIYTSYVLSRNELLFSILIGSVVIYTATYLFYHSMSLSIILASMGVATPRFRRQALLDRRRNRLKVQFKEALFSLTSSLAAGRSLENAFRGALDDMRLLYTDPATDILREFQFICYRLENAEPLESALRDLAKRAQIEEITQFVDALSACKRSGGDLLEVMKRASTIIGEKLTVESEIMVMLAQKRFEAKIMMAVPFIFLSFLAFAAPDYMEPLYNGIGYVLLTVVFLVLLVCFWIMNKIMRIKM